MLIPVHVAQTLPNGTFAALAAWPGRFVIEVGASDRNTMDVELLPRWPNAFLVTAEPLVDKVARALVRRAPAHKVVDGFEPLGQHHARGLALPIAVGPTKDPNGELQHFHVGAVAGCSSLANVSKAHVRGRFGAWCQSTKEVRDVWTVPLAALLDRLPARARVALLKIDAQGYDLNVVASAGDAIGRIDYIAMEVISDDCAPLYEGQLRCSEVVEAMLKRDFYTLSHVPCTPQFQRRRVNHYCELEIVFRKGMPIAGTPPRAVHELHNLHFNGCDVLYNHADRLGEAWKPGQLFAVPNGWHGPKYERDRPTKASRNSSLGHLYACPKTCVQPTTKPADTVLGRLVSGASGLGPPCPW